MVDIYEQGRAKEMERKEQETGSFSIVYKRFAYCILVQGDWKSTHIFTYEDVHMTLYRTREEIEEISGYHRKGQEEERKEIIEKRAEIVFGTDSE